MSIVRRLLRYALVVAWMGLIFWLSSQPDLKVTGVAHRLGLLPWQLPPLWLNVVETILRKGAHVAAYAILAILVYRALAASWPRAARSRLLWAAFGIAVLYAVSDEWHQALVPGRDGRVFDVLIDAFGAYLGLKWCRT